jgi:hypothetical protein
MRDNYEVCYHWYGGNLKMMPLLSTMTTENGHSSVSIRNDTRVHDAKKSKIVTRFSFVFTYKEQPYFKIFRTFKFKLK